MNQATPCSLPLIYGTNTVPSPININIGHAWCILMMHPLRWEPLESGIRTRWGCCSCQVKVFDLTILLISAWKAASAKSTSSNIFYTYIIYYIAFAVFLSNFPSQILRHIRWYVMSMIVINQQTGKLWWFLDDRYIEVPSHSWLQVEIKVTSSFGESNTLVWAPGECDPPWFDLIGFFSLSLKQSWK